MRKWTTAVSFFGDRAGAIELGASESGRTVALVSGDAIDRAGGAVRLRRGGRVQVIGLTQSLMGGLEALEPNGVVAAARKELAEELLGGLRRLGLQLAELNRRLAAVVAASGTTTTKEFGVGPVVAAITVGLTKDVRRVADKGHFAAFNGVGDAGAEGSVP
jgi:hypothetical protein